MLRTNSLRCASLAMAIVFAAPDDALPQASNEKRIEELEKDVHVLQKLINQLTVRLGELERKLRTDPKPAREGTQDPPDLPPSKETVPISSQMLAYYFQKHRTFFSDAYHGKNVTVVGTVSEITKAGDVLLDPNLKPWADGLKDKKLPVIVCKTKSIVKALTKGADVVVKGKCEGAEGAGTIVVTLVQSPTAIATLDVDMYLANAKTFKGKFVAVTGTVSVGGKLGAGTILIQRDTATADKTIGCYFDAKAIRVPDLLRDQSEVEIVGIGAENVAETGSTTIGQLRDCLRIRVLEP